MPRPYTQRLKFTWCDRPRGLQLSLCPYSWFPTQASAEKRLDALPTRHLYHWTSGWLEPPAQTHTAWLGLSGLWILPYMKHWPSGQEGPGNETSRKTRWLADLSWLLSGPQRRAVYHTASAWPPRQTSHRRTIMATASVWWTFVPWETLRVSGTSYQTVNSIIDVRQIPEVKYGG